MGGATTPEAKVGGGHSDVGGGAESQGGGDGSWRHARQGEQGRGEQEGAERAACTCAAQAKGGGGGGGQTATGPYEGEPWGRGSAERARAGSTASRGESRGTSFGFR